MDAVQHSIGSGLDRVWAYDNISIIILVLCLLGSAAVNIWMLTFFMKWIGNLVGSLEKLNKAVGHDEDH